MSDRVVIRRLPTGVPGLDEILGGGVPEGREGAGSAGPVVRVSLIFLLAPAGGPGRAGECRPSPGWDQ